MRERQPKDYVEMTTGQWLVVGVCLLIAGLVVGAWAIGQLAALTP